MDIMSNTFYFPLNAYRGDAVLDIVARVAHEYPLIRGEIDKFVINWKQAAIEASGLDLETATSKQFEKALKEVGEPPQEYIFSFAFPMIWTIAKSEVYSLLAICSSSNPEVEEAVEAGKAMDDFIAEKVKILKRSTLEDIAVMAAEGYPQLVDQIQRLSNVMGKAMQAAMQPGTSEQSPSGASAPSSSQS
jgi:hypothetical protein